MWSCYDFLSDGGLQLRSTRGHVPTNLIQPFPPPNILWLLNFLFFPFSLFFYSCSVASSLPFLSFSFLFLVSGLEEAVSSSTFVLCVLGLPTDRISVPADLASELKGNWTTKWVFQINVPIPYVNGAGDSSMIGYNWRTSQAVKRQSHGKEYNAKNQNGKKTT